MTYREKTCPTCNKSHKKRGPYCSRSCGNHRTWTTEQKQVFSEKKKEFLYNTEEGEVERWRINSTEEEEPLLPQQPNKLESNQFVQDGDLWTSD
jgi:endogenous inhibitor of DNA gyrase (YacG/DUF329 family)